MTFLLNTLGPAEIAMIALFLFIIIGIPVFCIGLYRKNQRLKKDNARLEKENTDLMNGILP